VGASLILLEVFIRAGGAQEFLGVLFLLFVVIEALILLSALFRNLRTSGLVFRRLILK
jgi:hypothetical protein